MQVGSTVTIKAADGGAPWEQGVIITKRRDTIVVALSDEGVDVALTKRLDGLWSDDGTPVRVEVVVK